MIASLEKLHAYRDRIALAVAIALPALAVPFTFLEDDGVFVLWLFYAVLFPYVVCRIATTRIFLLALLTNTVLVISIQVLMTQKDKRGLEFLLSRDGLHWLAVMWGIASFLSLIPALSIYLERRKSRTKSLET